MMRGELAAVVPSQGVYAGAHRVQGDQDGFGNRLCPTVVHHAQTCPSALAVHRGDDTGGTLADNGVAFPITHTITPFDNGWAFVDALAAKALAFLWCSPTVAPSPLAPSTRSFLRGSMSAG